MRAARDVREQARTRPATPPGGLLRSASLRGRAVSSKMLLDAEQARTRPAAAARTRRRSSKMLLDAEGYCAGRGTFASKRVLRQRRVAEPQLTGNPRRL